MPRATSTSRGSYALATVWGALTTKKLQRFAHQSVTALADDITDWVARWNNDPKPLVWVKTADEILASIGRYAGAVRQAAGPINDATEQPAGH